jgi:hypothetical protein
MEVDSPIVNTHSRWITMDKDAGSDGWERAASEDHQ